MQVFRTYLQSIKKNKIVLQNISQGHSSRINGREPQQPESPRSKYCTYEKETITDIETFSFRLKTHFWLFLLYSGI